MLQAAVASVAWARSTEESRPALCGVLVRVRGGRLTTVATNGHRLARDVRALHGANETAAVEASAVDLPDLILPARAVEALKGFAANERLTLAVEVSAEGKAGTVVAVRGTRTEVTARLIEGPYPAFERVTPSDTPHTAVLDGDALAAMVKRVAGSRVLPRPSRGPTDAHCKSAGHARRVLRGRY